MWKLLTGIIAEDAYWYLDDWKLLPEGQKGARKRSRGTHNLLFIDNIILLCRMLAGKKNLFMAWID